MRSLMRVRSASPTSMFLPETRNGMIASDWRSRRPAAAPSRTTGGDLTSKYDNGRRTARCQRPHPPTEPPQPSECRSHRVQLLAPPLDGGGDPHRLAILRNRPPCDVDPGLAQFLDDGVVRQYVLRVFGIDHLFDAVAHRFRRMRLATIRSCDRGGEEILEFEDASAGRHVLVGGDARDRRLVHIDGVSHGLQIERPQMLHALHEERILLTYDLLRDLEDGLGP